MNDFFFLLSVLETQPTVKGDISFRPCGLGSLGHAAFLVLFSSCDITHISDPPVNVSPCWMGVLGCTSLVTFCECELVIPRGEV